MNACYLIEGLATGDDDESTPTVNKRKSVMFREEENEEVYEEFEDDPKNQGFI